MQSPEQEVDVGLSSVDTVGFCYFLENVDAVRPHVPYSPPSYVFCLGVRTVPHISQVTAAVPCETALFDSRVWMAGPWNLIAMSMPCVCLGIKKPEKAAAVLGDAASSTDSHNSVDRLDETTRGHPEPARLRLQYRF